MFGRTAIVAIFILALCALFAPSLEKQGFVDVAKARNDRAEITTGKQANTADTAPVQSQPSGGGADLARDYDGHFRASVRVNGTEMMMMVDSGASVVVLGEAQAVAAGIIIDPAAFTGTAQTAGGTVATMPVTLDRISVGGIDRSNVEAAVIRGDLPQPLLGQSFLSTLDMMNVEGNRMRLR